MSNSDDNGLIFFYPALTSSISTNMLDIETYSNNLVVAPTIGNLVTYFSDERPVPYLASKWRRDGKKWIFDIREGLKCEDGEEITALSFSESLARSIRLYSQIAPHPVFKNLKGYKELLRDRSNTFRGIYAEGSSLVFDFEIESRGGFLEHLTMAPFGYICSANFDGDNWKDNTEIVASGPYRLNKILEQNDYTLIRRDDWPSQFQGDFSKVVINRSGLEEFRKASGHKIIETQNPTSDDLDLFSYVRQIPQNLVVVKLNPYRGVFRDIETRQQFLNRYRFEQKSYAFTSNSTFKTDRFFANDSSILKTRIDVADHLLKNLNVVMKVMLRGPNSPNNINKEIIEKIGNEYNWNLTIDSEPYESFRDTFQDPKYDLYVQAAEIGGGFEGWVIDMLFCSDVGDKWPDPSGRICKLANEFDISKLNIQDASQRFQDYLIEDAALIPSFHRGGFYLFGDEIDVKSIGPMATRIRFEEVKKSND